MRQWAGQIIAKNQLQRGKNNMDTQSTLNYIVKKFNLDLNQEMPIMIPDTDRVSLAGLFGMLGFKEKEFFKTSEEERKAVKVKFE